jgi:hypothetical protein
MVNRKTALNSWLALNLYLKKASLEQVGVLLDYERKHSKRKSYLKRLIKRYCMLEAKQKIEQELKKL